MADYPFPLPPPKYDRWPNPLSRINIVLPPSASEDRAALLATVPTEDPLTTDQVETYFACVELRLPFKNVSWKLKYRGREYQGRLRGHHVIYGELLAEVPHRDHAQPVAVTLRRDFCVPEGALTRDFLERHVVRTLVTEFMLHEVDESILVGGARPFDPHVHERPAIRGLSYDKIIVDDPGPDGDYR